MKLTNISLAILVAIGLVACGGSDDNKNQPTDNNNAGHQGAGNGNPPPPPPPKEKDVKDPDNRASALEVEKRLETNTAVAKTIYANPRKSLDILMGYDENGKTFEEGSVDDGNKDLKRANSIVNYVQAGWINDNTKGGTLRLHPTQTYAKDKDGKFYRVRFIRDSSGNNKPWDAALLTDRFYAVDNVDTYTASDLYFIPNAQTANGVGAAFDSVGNQNHQTFTPTNNIAFPPATATIKGGGDHVSALGSLVLGDTSRPGANLIDLKNLSNEQNFDTSRGDVSAVNILVGGKTYDVTGQGASNSYKLDLGLDPKEEIQTLPVEFTYRITDDKGTVELRDNDYIDKKASAGELRVYNLNYSLALLEVNEAAKVNSGGAYAAARNGLGFEGKLNPGSIVGFGNASGEGTNGRYGPFQVQGFQTTVLPLNGRATYLGQSFGVNSKGQIDLTLDFGEERAGIHGSVTKRTTMDGKTSLPDMNLNLIKLSQPNYSHTGTVGIDPNSDAPNGVVDLGGATNWGTWAVQLYGPNAENAAGVIAQGVQLDKGKTGVGNELGNVVEVFDSARTDINPKSLNNPKNP